MATENREFILDPEDEDAPIQTTTTKSNPSNIMSNTPAKFSDVQAKGFSRQCENPACGKWIHHRSVKCPSCGTVQAAAAEAAAKTGETRKSKGTGEPSAPKASKARASSPAGTVDKTALIRVLAGRGFKFTRLVNSLTGEVVEEKTDPKIDNLNLQFTAVPSTGAQGIYVTQTNPQILVTMTLDAMLDLGKIKP